MTPRYLQPLEWFQQRNGWGESFNADKLIPGWKYSGLPEYTSIVGADRAWCMMSINLMCHDLGLRGNNRADAISGVKSFLHCQFYPGCGGVVEHASGHHHIALFTKPRVTFGGNQNNMICEKPLASDDKVLCYFTFIDLATGLPIEPTGPILAPAPPTPASDPAPAKEISASWPKLGDSGLEVEALQKMLKARGFDPGPIDGQCGPRTMAAVVASQKPAQTSTPPVTPSAPPTGPVANLGKMPWSEVKGSDAWSVALMQDVTASGLPDLVPKIIEEFCPQYGNLNRDARIIFWVHLIAKMSEFESGFNPHSIYHEPPPLGVDSIGLLQLSYEDAENYPLPPLRKNMHDLEVAEVNLKCAVIIMEKLVHNSGIFCGQNSAGQWKGVSAYWSVMRHTKSGSPRPSYQKIKEHCLSLKLS